MVTYHSSEALLAIKNAVGVAYTDADGVLGANMEVDGGLQDVHELGARAPVAIKEGHITNSGDLERDYESGNFSAIGSTLLAALQAGTEVWPAIYPEGDASPEIKLNNAKLGGWRLSVGLGGLVKERATYRGLSISEA